jgi:hypothetical protein
MFLFWEIHMYRLRALCLVSMNVYRKGLRDYMRMEMIIEPMVTDNCLGWVQG